MNLRPVFDLLADAPFRRVDDVGALAAIGQEPNLALPAAFVIADSEQAAPPVEGSYVLNQVIQSSFAVAIAVRPDGARKGAAAEELDELEEAVLSRLFGKQMDGWDSPLVLVDIRTVEISAAFIARVVRLRGRRRRRIVMQP